MRRARRRDVPATVSRVPLAVTLARLVFGPVFVFSFYLGAAAPDFFLIYLGAVGYALTALADMVDGYLARRLNSVTPLGALLDPVTDIVNRLCALLALSALGIAPWRLMAVYILLVLQYAVDTRPMGPPARRPGASTLGKYIAAAYDVVIAASLLQLIFIRTVSGPYLIPPLVHDALAAAALLFIARRAWSHAAARRKRR